MNRTYNPAGENTLLYTALQVTQLSHNARYLRLNDVGLVNRNRKRSEYAENRDNDHQFNQGEA